MEQSKLAQPGFGMLCGLGAAIIWGAWPVVTSIGVKESFSPFQIVLLRFVIAGILLAPFAFRGPSSWKGWGKALVYALCAGVPYGLVVSTAFQHAPASHGGVVIPGTVLVASVLAAHFWLGERLTRTRAIGAGIILIGLGLLASGAEGGLETLRGDMLFVAGGVMWASYTFLLRQWPMDGLVVASRVSLISLAIVSIGSLMGFADGITSIPAEALLIQGVWQGILSAIVALLMFNRAVAILGSGRAATLNTLTPMIAVLLSFLILGEAPTSLEMIGLVVILSGIATALGLKPFKLFKPKTLAVPLLTRPGTKPCIGPDGTICK